jgi:glycosyltransferase involved in cell wall biosynthesis
MHDNHLTYRGSTTALVDYAYHLSNMGHDITIGYKQSNLLNDKKVISRLSNIYELRPYEEFKDIQQVEQKYFDLAYFIKAGFKDGVYFTNTQSAIHCVFQYFEPHGDRYAYVSEWLANKVKKKTFVQGFIRRDLKRIKNSFSSTAWVPHMISLPTIDSNLRSELGIPSDAVVGLRYGGFDTFDLPFVHEAIRLELESNPNFWFVAVNTKKFWQHPRLIDLPGFFDNSYKVALLNTADFFLHARSNGESFGLAILEAMHQRLPVLSWRGGTDKNHLTLLPRGSTYLNVRDLRVKIQGVKNYTDLEINAQTAENFSPKKVMDKFIIEFM